MMECGTMIRNKEKELCILMMVQFRKGIGLMTIYKEKGSYSSQTKVYIKAILLKEISMDMELYIRMMDSYLKGSGSI